VTVESPIVGADGFVAALGALDVEVTTHDTLLVYRVTPACGAAAGQTVETAVEASELASWPRVGPHWIHAPDPLRLEGNPQPSARSGWIRYSRPHPGRLDVGPAGRAWLAHVTAFLGTAT
jgi:hypothetical protein